MTTPAERWVLAVGSEVVYRGRCALRDIMVWVPDGGDYVDVYDGLDATMGKRFCRIESALEITWDICLGSGVIFDTGIYIAASSEDVETTVAFDPLPP